MDPVLLDSLYSLSNTFLTKDLFDPLIEGSNSSNLSTYLIAPAAPGPSLTTTGCCSETVIYPGSGLGISDPHSSKNVVSGITTSEDSNVSFIIFPKDITVSTFFNAPFISNEFGIE